MADVTYDFGLAKVFVAYTSDDGNTYVAECRKAYSDTGAFGLAECSENAHPALPVGRKPRYLHLEDAPDAAGKVKKRKAICSAGVLVAFAQNGTPVNPIVDGITWSATGFTGERTVG